MMEKPPYHHISLRNPNINYRSGWWAVTIQVAKNKSIFGAIAGTRVILNTLGRAVEAYWAGLPEKYPELELFDFVVMPNHFHALLRIHFSPENREHHLGFLMSRFKGGTSFLYGRMCRTGEIGDIGEHLWQRDYWDDLVTNAAVFKGWQKYIRENPANWSIDRYGACTSYTLGDTELLTRPRVAFVASQGFYASDLQLRKIWMREMGATEVARFDKERHGCDFSTRFDKERQGCDFSARFDKERQGCDFSARSDKERQGCDFSARSDKERQGCDFSARFDKERQDGNIGGGGFSRHERSEDAVLISTFTSAQEREVLRRALAKKRPLIAVFPAGLPGDGEWPVGLPAAIHERRALAISPQPPGSRLNKKIATWCNEFLLKNADVIWAGDLSPNGMLMQILAGLGRLREGC